MRLRLLVQTFFKEKRLTEIMKRLLFALTISLLVVTEFFTLSQKVVTPLKTRVHISCN